MLSTDDIKKLRHERRMTQSELAERAGLSKSLVAQIETGQRKVTEETSSKLLTAFSSTKSLGIAATAKVDDLSDDSVVLMWRDKTLQDDESHIIRTLAKLLVEQRK
ncbi:helix-turn-helix domain-containing protein [Lacticaseibacillus mingshuiensis]|uniref:Helix-turn-helix domain-containing protein n=1 Tax=Lacticaseibacillus mingshuiensis TaxID=2799574 RepID=A0ABW4CEI6_9LACO|nr:helix-turn-helix transcriptional regulator [Lacticaseibacillus mingshuiensis]